MRKNKILTILVAFMLILTCFAVGCTKKPKDNSSSPDSSGEKEVTIYIVESLTLQEYKSINVEFEISGASESEIVWTSSNPEVARVENAVVYGISVGEATITASVGEAKATCVVTVTKNTSYPVLKISQQDVMPRVGGEVLVLANILFNGEEQDFTRFAWESENEEIATVENGLIKGVKAGETVVKVTAEYNGVRLEETVKVKVILVS